MAKKRVRRIKVPLEWTVGKQNYRVVFVKEIDTHGSLGLCDSGNKTILIKDGQSIEEQWKTLIHELLHAVEFSWGIDIPHKTVHELEHALYRLLRDNSP